MTKQINISINGMSCTGCATRLTKVLQNNPNIQTAEVNFATNTAKVSGDLNLANVISIIKQAGFSVPTYNSQFNISGMSCTGCATRLTKVLQNNPNIQTAEVNFATNTAQITVLTNYEKEQIIKDISQAGFGATIVTDDNQAELNSKKKLNWQLISVISALVLALPLMLPMLGIPVALWVQFALASLVQFGFGLKFYKSAYLAIKSLAGNMDLLVAIGTSCAYGLSIYLWLFSSAAHHHLYFEASSMVIALVLLGKYLEQGTKKQTGSALASLQKLRPSIATVVRDNKPLTVAVSELVLDDILQVKAGESFASDGIIIEGNSDVDESLLNGESSLLYKTVGDKVHAGTINNNGTLLVKVTALGKHTQLGAIIRLVESAQSEKAPIQKLVDKISYYFVLTVLLIAIITFLIWLALGASLEQALINAVTVLVIACPCALGLATPAAIMVGVGLAARHGILLHKPHVLEQSTQINAVVFDKTGTLTVGKPQLNQIDVYNDINQQQALIWATSLQVASNHPLGSALSTALHAQNLAEIAVKNAKLVSGGVIGEIESKTLALGNSYLLKSLDFNFKDNDETQTSSYLVQTVPSKQVLAKFSFSDELKTQSAPAIYSLNAQNIKTYILSGDKSKVCAEVASILGVTDFKAEVIPEQKSMFIKELQNKGLSVAMVGDGVNDAPALALADIGIAMGSGNDVALSSSDITLLNNNPQSVVNALFISRKTYAKIKQNLFWAFVYNLCGIPLAACGVLNPVLAGFMMAASSVCVISNSLLLNKVKLAS